MAIAWNYNYEGTTTFSDVSWVIGLTGGAEQSITIPGTDTTSYEMLLSYNSTANIIVGYNVTATIPDGDDLTNQQYNELRPYKRYVNGGDDISFITPDDAGTSYVGVSLRQIN